MRNRIFLAGFTSLVFAYTLYVYVLQTTAFFSRSRLVFALAIGVVLFVVLWNGAKVLRLPPNFSQNAAWGIASLVLLVHLVAAGLFFQLPYTYGLLPIQTIRIQPLEEAKPVRLVSLSTELVAWVGLENFLESEGWRAGQGGIVLEEERQNELVWQGRPGQFVELRFQTCPQCGKVRVHWQDAAVEDLDLAANVGGNSHTIRFQYPSLFIHQAVNLIALEVSLLLLAVWGWAMGRSIFDRFPDGDGRDTGGFPFLKHLPFVGLAALTWVVYGMKIQPILFNDDWCFVYKLTFDIIEPSIIRRPLLPILIRLLMNRLPLQTMVYAVYYIEVGLLLATSVLIFLLINRLFERRIWFAFLTAALFLVFPADYTRLNFTMAGIRLGYLLMVAGMIWMVDFVTSGKLSLLVALMLALAASLLMYEGQLGLIAAFPGALLFLFWGRLHRKYMPGFVGYYLVVALFLIWKLFVQPHIFADSKFSSLTFSPGEIIARYLDALRLIPDSYTFPYRDASWLTPENLWIGSLMGIGTIGIGLITLALFKSRKIDPPLENSLQTNAQIFLTGLVFWVAGYLPLILNFPPNLYGHLSRVNMFSILGSVLMLLALLHTACLSLSRKEGLAVRVTVGFSLGLVLAGGLIQVQIQEANNQAWAENSAFYRALFHAVPDLNNGTHLILTLKGYETHRELYRPLLSSSWEAWCAFGLLYGKTDLQVNYQYDKIATPHLSTPGVLTSVLEKQYLTPIQDPGRLIIIEYDNRTQNLLVQKDAPGFLAGATLETYAPENQIVPLQIPIEAREIFGFVVPK